jgi:hypothetical protein
MSKRELIDKPVRAKMLPMQALLVVAVLLSIWLLLHEAGSEIRSMSWWLASWPWMVWIISPYLPLYLLGRRHGSQSRCITLYILTVVVIGFAASIYIDGFFKHLGAQSALLFIFVPAYQWLIIGGGGIIYLILSLIFARRKAG